MRDYRMRKIEYYGKSMGFYNVYLYFLLPVFTVFSIVMFTWKATVIAFQFQSTWEALIEFTIVILSIAALMAAGGADQYTFFSGLLLVFSVLAYNIYLAIMDMVTLTRASSNASIEVGATLDGFGKAIDTAMSGMGAMGEATGGIAGALTNFISKFTTVAFDVTKFIIAIRAELYIAVCLLIILYFIRHSRFFLTPLEKFRESEVE